MFESHQRTTNNEKTERKREKEYLSVLIIQEAPISQANIIFDTRLHFSAQLSA